MIKMIVFAAIAAVIEIIQMTAFNKSAAGGKTDPDAWRDKYDDNDANDNNALEDN